MKKNVAKTLTMHMDLFSDNDYSSIMQKYGNYQCKNFLRIKSLNYFEIYKKSEKCHVRVFQDGEEHKFYSMDPFKDAVIAVYPRHVGLKNFKLYFYKPKTFNKVIVLKKLEYLRPNFKLFDVFSSTNTKPIQSFEELSPDDDLLCISKQALDGNKIIIKYHSK